MYEFQGKNKISFPEGAREFSLLDLFSIQWLYANNEMKERKEK